MGVLAMEWITLLLHGDQSQCLFSSALSALKDSHTMNITAWHLNLTRIKDRN